MQSSAAYQEFRTQLNEMQSKTRVANLVSDAASWARNLPETAEVFASALVLRVARYKGVEVTPDEVSQATKRLEQTLQLEHL